MNKKIIACAMTAVTIFSSVSALSISADNLTQTENIISYGRNLIGKPDYNGYCQRFVRICYESAGLYSSIGANSAMDAWNNWGISDSRENIPIGACLYFNTSEYGHVAIYTGNNQMVHGVKIVKEEQISDYYWSKFLGWGYQGGNQPSGIIYENDIETAYPSIPYTYISSCENDVNIYWNSTGENTSYYTLNVYNTDTGEIMLTSDYSTDINSEYINLPQGNYCTVVKAVNMDYENSMSYSNYYTFTITNPITGDVNHNGIIDLADLAMMGQYLSYDLEFNENTLSLADVNYDGNIDMLDYMTLKQYLVKLIEI